MEAPLLMKYTFIDNTPLLMKPVPRENSKLNEEDPNWIPAIGYLAKNCVLVHEEEFIERLYCMGCFGKGTLSDAPKICFHKEIKEQRSTTLEEKESLELTFQEAYFLSYGLRCLNVKDQGKELEVQQLWKKFCQLTPSGNFPVMYAAYHHLRSKGWTIKSGLKFGTDYILYKDGPAFYRATFAVIVQRLKENLKESQCNERKLTYSSLVALNKVVSAGGMGLIILDVIKPNSLTEGMMLSSPSCISKFKIQEVLFARMDLSI